MQDEDQIMSAVDALTVAVAVCEKYSLTVPEDATVRIIKADWTDRNDQNGVPFDPPLVGVIKLSMRYEDLDLAQRRALKRDFTLEIPRWQINVDYMDSKSLEGYNVVGLWKIAVEIRQAYVCEVVGEIEEEPSEHTLNQAADMEQLTDEQMLFLTKLQIAKARKPIVRKRLKCRPVDRDE